MHYLQKELYQRLKQDDSIFDFIQEAALDGLWYWDLEQPENEWMNQKFWTTLGYDPGEMPHTAAAWQNIIFEEDLEAAKKQIEDHFRQPEKYGYDQIVRYRHKKGHTVWIRCRGIARFSADGTPVRMLGAHTDVTELKRIESQYARQARYYRSLVETQTSYVCRLDFEGRYLTSTPNLPKILIFLNLRLMRQCRPAPIL